MKNLTLNIWIIVFVIWTALDVESKAVESSHSTQSELNLLASFDEQGIDGGQTDLYLNLNKNRGSLFFSLARYLVDEVSFDTFPIYFLSMGYGSETIHSWTFWGNADFFYAQDRMAHQTLSTTTRKQLSQTWSLTLHAGYRYIELGSGFRHDNPLLFGIDNLILGAGASWKTSHWELEVFHRQYWYNANMMDFPFLIGPIINISITHLTAEFPHAMTTASVGYANAPFTTTLSLTSLVNSTDLMRYGISEFDLQWTLSDRWSLILGSGYSTQWFGKSGIAIIF